MHYRNATRLMKSILSRELGYEGISDIGDIGRTRTSENRHQAAGPFGRAEDVSWTARDIAADVA